jgi:hypothetical protein
MTEARPKARPFYAAASREAEAAVGPQPQCPKYPKLARDYYAYKAACKVYDAAKAPWDAAFKASKSYQRGEKLWSYAEQFGTWTRYIRVDEDNSRAEYEFWRATAGKKGILYFHPPDVPIRIWAVKIDPNGVHWFDAEVLKVTASNVMARYAGEIARLDRDKLWRWWAWWRGVMFVSSRTGRIAAELEEAWHERYGRATGGVPRAMRIPLDEARRLRAAARLQPR